MPYTLIISEKPKAAFRIAQSLAEGPIKTSSRPAPLLINSSKLTFNLGAYAPESFILK